MRITPLSGIHAITSEPVTCELGESNFRLGDDAITCKRQLKYLSAKTLCSERFNGRRKVATNFAPALLIAQSPTSVLRIRFNVPTRSYVDGRVEGVAGRERYRSACLSCRNVGDHEEVHDLCLSSNARSPINR